MYQEISISMVRTKIRQVVDEYLDDGHRLMITRNGRPVAALVSPHDLKALEKADGSRMEFHEQMQLAQLREIRWLKEGLDGVRTEEAGSKE